MASTGNMKSETKWTPGPYSEPAPYGRVGFEIIAGGRSIAVVNRVANARLDHLEAKRAAAAKRGEPGHQEEQEAREIEATREEALATAYLFRAAPDLAIATRYLAELVEVLVKDARKLPARYALGDESATNALEIVFRARQALAAAGVR